MPNQKRYDNLSKRQIYRRLAVQSKADLHDLHDSSLEFTNEPESADDICYIRQELPKGKNNLHVRIDDESEPYY